MRYGSADRHKMRAGHRGARGSWAQAASATADASDFRFLRFRPPKLEREGTEEPTLPHIRLDRALQFLIGDKLS